MPTYDILPVYKTSYDLLLAIFNFSQSLTREYKYTIGDNLKTETVAMITNIYRANSTQINRYDRIQSARENLVFKKKISNSLDEIIEEIKRWSRFLEMI
jgi:hypothetical protein